MHVKNKYDSIEEYIVTRNLQHHTIDSLFQVIQNLQNQIKLLQSSGGFGL